MIIHKREKLQRCKLENEHLRLENMNDLKSCSRYVANIGMAIAENGSPAPGRWGWITFLVRANSHSDSPPLWQVFHRQPWPSVLHTPKIQ